MAQASTMSYEVVEGWEQLPAGWEHRDVAGVAVDAESRVYLICRGEHPIIVYDSQGNFIRSWGEGDFTLRTHGITVGPDGTVYATDDGNHTVRQFTPGGKLLMTLGTLNTPFRHRVRRQEHGHRNQARRALQSPDQRGDRTPGRRLRLRRLRELPGPPLLAHRRAEALVGSGRPGPRPSSSCPTASR